VQALAAPYRAANEFADDALPERLRRPMAIVKAKRTSRNPLGGERQASDCAERIQAAHGVVPFIFLANGAGSGSTNGAALPFARSAASSPSMPDSIAQRHWIVFGPAGEGAFVEAYRDQIAAFIRDLAAQQR
jgi:hypothetical protein